MLMCLLGATFVVFSSLFFLVGLHRKGSVFFPMHAKCTVEDAKLSLA